MDWTEYGTGVEEGERREVIPRLSWNFRTSDLELE
jgi:hypothetical protein